MTLMQKLFSFQGRLRRRDYWLLSFLIVGVVIVIFMLAGALGVNVAQDSGEAALLQLVASLVILWPSLALGVKRCHDRNQSGRWLLMEIIPLVGGLWALINLGILDGTQGPNRFGPSPKGIGGDTAPELEKVFA